MEWVGAWKEGAGGDIVLDIILDKNIFHSYLYTCIPKIN